LKKSILLLMVLSVLVISSCDLFHEDWIIEEQYLCTVDTTGQNFQYLIKAEDFSQYVVPPDNSKILIFKSGAIYSTDLDGSNYQLYSQCSDSLKFVNNLSWAVTPEGFRIIWCYADDIFAYDYNNDEFTQVTDTPDIEERYCCFSNDGIHITYCSWIRPDTVHVNPWIDSSINVMSYDYSGKTCIIEEQVYDIVYLKPIISEDKVLYYVSGTDSLEGIYSINIDGTDNTNLYNDIITPHQRFVAIEEENSVIFTDSYYLYKLNYENGDLIELAAGEQPRLSDSGNYIAFYYGFLEIMDTNGNNHIVLREGYTRTINQPPVFYHNDEKILFILEKKIKV